MKCSIDECVKSGLTMEHLIQMGCDLVIYIFYETDKNIFYDDHGHEIYNIYEFITPNDMLLFKKDNAYNTIKHHKERNVIVEILVDYDKE